MIEALAAFVDESGNSGRNYLDAGQPFYVLGGWAINDTKLDRCRQVLRKWETGFPARGSEIKSATVLKRKDGLTRSFDLFKALLDEEAVPTCCVFEKRFGICINLTETFFPGLPATMVGPFPLPDARARSEFAETLFGIVSDELMIRFALAVHARDLEAFGRVRDDLRDELLGAGAVLPAAQIASLPLDLLADFPFMGSNAVNSINATVFHSQLMLLEHLCHQHAAKSWSLFHDEIPSFEEVLRFTLDHSTKMPDTVLRQSNGLTLYLGRLRLNQLRFVSSTSEPLIRCSDQYVGFVNAFFKGLLSERPLEIPDVDLGRALLNSTALGLPPMQFLTLSPEMHRRLATSA